MAGAGLKKRCAAAVVEYYSRVVLQHAFACGWYLRGVHRSAYSVYLKFRRGGHKCCVRVSDHFSYRFISGSGGGISLVVGRWRVSGLEEVVYRLGRS